MCIRDRSGYSSAEITKDVFLDNSARQFYGKNTASNGGTLEVVSGSFDDEFYFWSGTASNGGNLSVSTDEGSDYLFIQEGAGGGGTILVDMGKDDDEVYLQSGLIYDDETDEYLPPTLINLNLGSGDDILSLKGYVLEDVLFGSTEGNDTYVISAFPNNFSIEESEGNDRYYFSIESGESFDLIDRQGSDYVMLEQLPWSEQSIHLDLGPGADVVETSTGSRFSSGQQEWPEVLIDLGDDAEPDYVQISNNYTEYKIVNFDISDDDKLAITDGRYLAEASEVGVVIDGDDLIMSAHGFNIRLIGLSSGSTDPIDYFS